MVSHDSSFFMQSTPITQVCSRDGEVNLRHSRTAIYIAVRHDMHFDLRDISQSPSHISEHQKRLTAINLMEISSLVVLTEPPSLPVVGWLPLRLRLDGSSIILLRFIAGFVC